MLDIIFASILLILGLYFSVRNYQVYKFRGRVLDFEYEITLKKIHLAESVEEMLKIDTNFPIYSSLPSYNKMIFSFKPLNKYLKL